MAETKPFQIRIEPELLTALQEYAPTLPGKQSGAGLLLRRLGALFVGRPSESTEPELPDEAESFLAAAAADEDWESWEAERYVEDLLRFADRSRDGFERFKTLALVGKIQLLLYRRRRAEPNP